jgi:hypothetical protein
MHNKLVAPEKPTTALFMDTILDRQACPKHKAEKGFPCGWLGPHRVVCNKRARRAGFNHRISEKSLRLNRTPKR